MKRLLYSLVFVFIALTVLAVSSYAAAVYDSDNNKYLHTDEDIFYLPSHIKPQSVTFEENGEKRKIDLTEYELKDGNGNTTYRYISGTRRYLFYFANNLPSIYVTTSISLDTLLAPEDKRKTDKEAKLYITDKDGNVQYEDDESTYGQIKVRGNTTDDYNKQPFQIKLDTKHDLFGMGEAKTWILLANYLDQSLIRNSIMYKIGSLLGMKTSEFKSVDLYLNGEYYGVYLLCEKIQIHPERVDIFDLEQENEILNPNIGGFTRRKTSGTLIDETIITEYQYVRNIDNPADISGGYLVELDNNYYSDESCYFKTSNGNAYVIKSPEYASQEQVEYIARVFAEMEEAIYSPTGKNSRGLHYSQYADVESLAYAYIMQELGRNWDAGSSSMYFYKDADKNGEFTKIVKGPLWDCDNTLGNMLKGNANDPNGYWAKNRKLWEGLTQHEYFNYIVAREYARIYPEIIKMTEDGGYVSQLVNELGTSVAMERMRWGTSDYSKWPYYSYRLYTHGVHYDSWQGWNMTFKFSEVYSDGVDDTEETAIGYLKNHMINRANWLYNEWNYSEGDEAPSISKDGIINSELKPPAAPTFAPVYPETPDNGTDTNFDSSVIDSSLTTDTGNEADTDNITDIETDTSEATNSSTDVNNPNGRRDSKILYVVVIVAATLACVGIIGVTVALIKLKK